MLPIKSAPKTEKPRTLFIPIAPPAPPAGRPTNTVVYPTERPTEPKKKGRPSKEEKKREQLAKASAGIASLVMSKPKKKDIVAYIHSRIAELSSL